MVDIKQLIESAIEGTKVEVEGEGCNLSLTIISDELASMSPVKRQQAVYQHIAHLINEGTVHAVSMKFRKQSA